MMMPSSGPQVDGQWIDYYALLDVPANADEDTIRRRIGKLYAEASANSDHQNRTRREYFQSLVERVLPQCRRVLLDSEWRARYDHQHLLHRENDGEAQTYVAFIASMRSDGVVGLNEALLPQRAQDEINAARQVVETALSGAQLELLPSHTLSQRADINPADVDAADVDAADGIAPVEAVAVEAVAVAPVLDEASMPSMQADAPTEQVFAPSQQVAPASVEAVAPQQNRASDAPLEIVAKVHRSDQAPPPPLHPDAAPIAKPAPQIAANAPAISNADVAAAVTPAEVAVEPRADKPNEARATVITAQQAADIRRRRASNPDAEAFVGPSSRDVSSKKKPRSRVVVEVDDPAFKRKLSPTSLNLMVAITGVMLTITIQRFASTPAVATSAGRTPIVLAVAPSMENAVERAAIAWEKTPAGAGYDIVVQGVDSGAAMKRALDKSGDQIDGWIPSNAGYAQRYNDMAASAKRPALQIGDSLAQTPMVLVARADKAAALRAAFPDHKIGTWTALRDVVMRDAKGRFGLSDPRQSSAGAIVRYSMAREWGEGKNKGAEAAAKDAEFWKWMAGFEENIPSSAAAPDAMIKDMVLGTTGRYFWAVSYESDALSWLAQGKALEVFYLPRTTLADHPFCAVERVGAPIEVAAGRAAFVNYLKSDGEQKTLLQSGFRPTEISPSSAIEKNPFTAPKTRARGVQLQGLPRDERFNVGALGVVQKSWGQYYG